MIILDQILCHMVANVCVIIFKKNQNCIIRVHQCHRQTDDLPYSITVLYRVSHGEIYPTFLFLFHTVMSVGDTVWVNNNNSGLDSTVGMVSTETVG